MDRALLPGGGGLIPNFGRSLSYGERVAARREAFGAARLVLLLPIVSWHQVFAHREQSSVVMRGHCAYSSIDAVMEQIPE